MNATDRNTAISFIRENFIQDEAKSCNLSPYGLKHVIQYLTDGVYMTEQEFKEIMDELGYKKSPVKAYYRMRLSPRVKRYLKEDGRLC